jgi:hypothetical protein
MGARPERSGIGISPSPSLYEAGGLPMKSSERRLEADATWIRWKFPSRFRYALLLTPAFRPVDYRPKMNTSRFNGLPTNANFSRAAHPPMNFENSSSAMASTGRMRKAVETACVALVGVRTGLKAGVNEKGTDQPVLPAALIGHASNLASFDTLSRAELDRAIFRFGPDGLPFTKFSLENVHAQRIE